MGRAAAAAAVGGAVAACAVATWLVGRRVRRRRRWGRAAAALRELEGGAATSTARLRQVVDAMAVEMHAGLASDGGSKLKMLLTFVDSLPDGSEKGTFYGLDLGGTNFRVLRVELGETKSAIVDSRVETQPIPRVLLSGSNEELFEFIARAVKAFVEKEGKGDSGDGPRRLGFTFSFPVHQKSVSSGILIKWSKGFAVEGTVGGDVARFLEEAMLKVGLDMKVSALVNDTVGTLALSHYHDEDTVAAVIIGTGTNACYVERTDAIIKCQGLLTSSGGMVVNIEWGNFWSSHLPRTPYDVELDEESPNKNDQGFEKMISGMYLGEIVRRVLWRMSQEAGLFGDAPVPLLATPFSLRTPMVAEMHEDGSPDLREVARVLEEGLQIRGVPLKTRRLVVRVCDVVSRRAARLAAAGIVGILKKIGRDGSGGFAGGRMKGKPRRSVVAIEGGLYVGYGMFREYLDEAVSEILGEEMAQSVVLRVTEDGSGVGAALLASTLVR
ncbi:hexokinase-like 1 isoform X2 [Wolffia australiana]